MEHGANHPLLLAKTLSVSSLLFSQLRRRLVLFNGFIGSHFSANTRSTRQPSTPGFHYSFPLIRFSSIIIKNKARLRVSSIRYVD
jgi:hypothetical protein